MKLSEAAEQLTNPTNAFGRFLASIRKVFNFTIERKNRIARFVRVVHAYKQGKPIQDIVKEQGCSKSTVLRYARLAGLDRRPKGFDPKIQKATISLLKQNKPYAEIAALLGVSQGYISKLAKANGLNRYNR